MKPRSATVYTHDDIQRTLEQLRLVDAATQRSINRHHVTACRCIQALKLLRSWKRKLALAQGKVKRYQKISTAYRRRLGI